MSGVLTAKQKRFIECYTGNATQAAVAAGYSPKTAYSAGQRLLKHVEVQTAIQARENTRMEDAIATREERQMLWTDIMRDKESDVRDRMRASELLGRSEGDFLDRAAVTNPDGSMTPKPVIDLGDRSIDELMALAEVLGRQEKTG